METIAKQMTWQWDPANNCVLQADSNLIKRVLKDFPLYDLTTNSQLPTTVTTTTQKQLLAEQALKNQQTHTAAHTANDSDSLSNSMLSQATWFTTTMTQVDALAMQQIKLETQTSTQLTTIMAELETIWASMEEQQNWQEQYNKYDRYNRDQPFTPEESHMESENYNNTNNTTLLWRMPAHTNERTNKYWQSHQAGHTDKESYSKSTKHPGEDHPAMTTYWGATNSA